MRPAHHMRSTRGSSPLRLKVLHRIQQAAASLAVLFSLMLSQPAFAINKGKEMNTKLSPHALSGNELAWQLLGRVKGNGDKNTFLSPLSISTALNIAYQGSRGEVRKKAFEMIHEQTEADTTLIREIESGASAPAIDFRSANAVCTDINDASMHDPEKAFANSILQKYQASFSRISFRPAEAVEKLINGWVSDKTNKMIKELVSKTDVQNSNMIIVDAVYFKGQWENPFQAELTKPKEFHGAERKSSPLFMDQLEKLSYFKSAQYSTVALPYAGSALELVIVLPNENVTPEQLQKQLTPNELETSISQSRKTKVHVLLPKFELEWGQTDLMPDLKAMGLPVRGDFTPLGSQDLELKKVIHKTAFKMNEQGSEAAAATAVIGMPGAGAPPKMEPPIDFKVDRPFLFVIREVKSGQWLFL